MYHIEYHKNIDSVHYIAHALRRGVQIQNIRIRPMCSDLFPSFVIGNDYCIQQYMVMFRVPKIAEYALQHKIELSYNNRKKEDVIKALVVIYGMDILMILQTHYNIDLKKYSELIFEKNDQIDVHLYLISLYTIATSDVFDGLLKNKCSTMSEHNFTYLLLNSFH